MTRTELSGSATPPRIVIGFDPGGQSLAEAVTATLSSRGFEVEYVTGSGSADYPDIAIDACRSLAAGTLHSAILICGTGLGMSITANKVPGIRAARCTDTYSVEKARRNSNANVLALGAEITAPPLATELVATWIKYEFDSERSLPKLRKIELLERLGADGE